MPTKRLVNIFSPEAVAIIGASNKVGSVGHSLMKNLIGHGYTGTVYPVNNKYDSIQGVHAYPSIRDVPRKIDLAIIAVPAKVVPSVVEECGQVGVKGVIIVSAGFKETGEEGVKLEKQVMETASKYGIRVVGPNCLGIINPRMKLNASFARDMPLEGNIAFISQSGALCSSIIDWANDIGIGFSYFVSIGSMLDVDYGDLIDFFGRDPKTTSIVIYMESVKNAKKFMSAASGFAKQKPIVIVKSGRFKEGREAVISHTGAIAGGDDVYTAAFKRAGVVRVMEIDELFDIAEKLALGPLPKGPKIAVITNAGGPGVMATDKIIELNGELAEIGKPMIERLNKVLPPSWSKGNPLDVLGDADSQRYKAALQECIKDKGIDSIMVMLTPQSGTDIVDVAKTVSEIWRETRKPIAACWMGGKSVEPARQLLRDTGIPVYPTPEKAVTTLILGYNYTKNLELLHETPLDVTEGLNPNKEKLCKLIEESIAKKHYVLSERESKEFLMEYGIHTNHAVLAKTKEDAVKAAEEMGYPVVLKIDSPQITHKTDAGGVILSIFTSEDVEKSYDRIITNARNYAPNAEIRGVAVMPMVTDRGFELLLGSKRDEVFGQVVVFGAGGTLVEVLQDKSIGLPPLTQTLARRMMEETKGFKLLRDGSRDRKPAKLREIEKTIIHFSQMLTDFPEIVEVDINPLLATADKSIALDARIVLGKDETPRNYRHLCIMPYPSELIEEHSVRTGEKVTIKPIKPEDEPRVKQLFETFSERTMHFRFFHALKDITHEMLVRYCHTDYDREIALIAEKDGNLLGMSRLMFDPGQSSAEFSVVVTDSWQKKGLGIRLVEKIIEVARGKKLERVYATVIKDNAPMKHLALKLGFRIEAGDDPQIDNLILDLK
ncbi:MAG: GNAT family N-acetyltransferase [Candidatus Altiarchaeota archaeon]|nr:GNAT family N-acetyltransferase [Candidatus Altiarchaeota archaeon]